MTTLSMPYSPHPRPFSTDVHDHSRNSMRNHLMAAKNDHVHTYPTSEKSKCTVDKKPANNIKRGCVYTGQFHLREK
jgi:hypothetical protein